MCDIKNNFEYDKKTVRAYGTLKEPWFSGKDICKILGHSDHKQTIRKNVDDEDMCRFENKKYHHTVLINKAGLFSLILRSNKSNAKRFKQWVTGEMLPAIGRMGLCPSTEIIKQSLIKGELEILEIAKNLLISFGTFDDKQKQVFTNKVLNIIRSKATFG